MFKTIYKKFKDENIVGQFIFINIAVYIIVAFIGVFATLLQWNNPVEEFMQWFKLPASFGVFITRPWTLFTYMFIHDRVMHILWNMLALYGFGRIFLSLFSVRHFVGVYILGGLLGGLFFMLSYNIFPYFAGSVSNAWLIGASASVLAVVTASATRSPAYSVNLFVFGSVRLVTIAVLVVVFSLLMLTSDNAGGHFAHLGGIFAGWLFAFMLNKGKDMTSWVNRTIDFFTTLFKSRKSKKRTFTYHRNERFKDYDYNARKKDEEDEIDKILEKVKEGGYSSLTEEEKRRLFEASRK